MMFNRILLPLDGSKIAEQALPYAIAQAENFQAELILLKVLEFLPKERSLSGKLVKDAFELTVIQAQEYLAAMAGRVQEYGLRVRVATVEGRPHVEIIQFAETNKVDLIVMCTRGDSGISRWLMGSVADRVIRGASVPVLLVHAKENKR